MASSRNVIDKALDALRLLPRVSLANIRNNPNAPKKKKIGRGQHGGKFHGCGQKRQSYVRIGFEGVQTPYYLQIPQEPYYKGHHLKRQYPPLSLLQLQHLIDVGFLDPTQPIDIISICNTKQYELNPQWRHFGVHLTDEGMDQFKAKVNIEVQWATEPVIAAVERNGGMITTAYYDVASLFAARNPLKFFKKGIPIPIRKVPPQDAIEYYTDAKFRGYLADPDKVADERLALAQKYGYELPELAEDPQREMLTMRKDPKQVFLGLEPGWVVNLTDKIIMKPKSKHLVEYYAS